MFLKFKLLIFFPSLFFSTLISISSSSWFSAWVGLEMNLMSMIPILIYQFNSNSIEATIKYFIFQALASTLIIFFVFLKPLLTHFYFNDFTNILLCSSLLIKTGMAPFQFWFPQVMINSNWWICLIILTWQKIAPFTLLSFSTHPFIFISVILSLIIGSLGGINQMNVKLILTYSSLIHSSWILTLIFLNSTFWWIYLVTYFFITFSLFTPFIFLNIKNINISYIFKSYTFPKLLFLINFFSMAGLPPFLGFTIKLLSISIFMKLFLNPMLIIFLMTSSLISFYFYLRMTYSILMNNMWILKLHNFNYYMFTHYSFLFMLFSFISIFGNLLFPTISLLI